MRLNLHIIKEDLTDLGLKGRIRAGIYERTLLYPQAVESWPETPSSEVLYLIRAEHLPSVPPRYGKLSIICIGEPSEAWQRTMHSVLWTSGDVRPIDALNELTHLFWRYNHWESELRKIIERGRPFADAAKVTQPLLANPFAALSISYRILFTSFPAIENPSEDYLRYLGSVSYDSPFMPDEDIISVITASQFDEIQRSTEPIMLSTAGYAYQTLVYTLRIGDEPFAYLCMDQVLSPISDRDRIVLKHLGDFLGTMLGKTDVYALTHPEAVQDVLKGLLDHRLLPEEHIAQLLSFFSWDMHDSFVTLCVALRDDCERQTALDALALSLARATSNECYIVRDKTICQVFDLTQMGISRDELISRIEPLLGRLWLDASVSSCFDDFKNLYYYFEQAEVAGQIGWHRDPTKTVHLYEDNAVGFLLDRLIERRSSSIAEVYFPDGLKLLIDHDREKGTEYAHLLDVYLRNDRNIAQTIRQEYIHRNTFNYRLRRIEEISGLDLDDDDVRLELMIAFRLLETEAR